MTRTIPDYLRLHIPSTQTPRRRGQTLASKQDLFWKVFAEATGWAMTPGSNASQVKLESVWQMDSVSAIEEAVDGPTISRDAAAELAKAAHAAFESTAMPAVSKSVLVTPTSIDPPHASPEDISESPKSVPPTSSETGLDSAANHNAPTNSTNVKLPTHLCSKAVDAIRQHLIHACVASNAAACIFYMLDEQYETLVPAASACVSVPYLDLDSRSIASSLADIDSLTGNFVAVDSLISQVGFAIPEGFPAAACVAINHREIPIGTLWIFFEDDREADATEEAILRLTASLISSIVQTHGYEQQLEKSTAIIRPLKAAAQWQRRQLTLNTNLAEGWQCGGWVQSPQALASSWFLWDILPDGMLAFVMAEAIGTGLDGAMIAATARSAWQAHAGYRHDPAQLLQRLNDTLWQTNSVTQTLSILYAQLNPDTGEGAFASAGNLTGLIASRFGYRPLVTPNMPLGSQIEANLRMHNLRLSPGETMLLHTPGLVIQDNAPSATSQAEFQQSLAHWWRTRPEEPLQKRLDCFRTEQPQRPSLKSDRTMLAIERSQSDGLANPTIR